jgi:hypothetical protein
MADEGGGDASHGAAEAVVEVVVDDGAAEAEADEEDTDAAPGLFLSSLHAASGNSTTAMQTSTTHRRERAIGAVLHRR